MVSMGTYCGGTFEDSFIIDKSNGIDSSGCSVGNDVDRRKSVYTSIIVKKKVWVINVTCRYTCIALATSILISLILFVFKYHAIDRFWYFFSIFLNHLFIV